VRPGVAARAGVPAHGLAAGSAAGLTSRGGDANLRRAASAASSAPGLP
jgi:hypothetical protein